MDGDPGDVPPPSVTNRRQGSKTPAQATSRLSDVEARADAIGQAAPFSAWPRTCSSGWRRPPASPAIDPEKYLIEAPLRCDTITIVAAGTVVSSVSNPGGRRVVFKIDDSPYAYGLFSLVDARAQGHDLIADEPVAVICIPHVAIRGELERMPSLWESIAVEVTRRARGMNLQMQQFVFDAPLVRAASLLLGMLARRGRTSSEVRWPSNIGCPRKSWQNCWAPPGNGPRRWYAI